MTEDGSGDLPRRLPAQYGRERVRQIARRGLILVGLIAAVTAAAGILTGWFSAAFMAVEALALFSLVALDRLLIPQLDRREQGNNGEIKVGAILDGLAPQGWFALHDVQTGRGNIDHVVVGPGGILTVETKSRRGRLKVGEIDKQWLSQAYAQRKWIESVMSEPADSLLVFSDAYLDRMVSTQRGVCVLPARALPGHLARRERRLSPEQVESLHSQLARAMAHAGAATARAA